MSVPVNICVISKAPERYGGLLHKFRFRPTRNTPSNWWRILDDREPGSPGTKRLITELISKLGLTAEWRPMRRLRPKRLRRPLLSLPIPLTARPKR